MRSLLPLALVIAAATSPAQSPTPAVGVLLEMEGDVSLVPGPGGAGHRPAALEWIPADARIRLGRDARASVVLRSGERFEIQGAGEVVFDERAATRATAHLRRLAPVPAMPRVVISPAEAPGTRAAAVRLRGLQQTICGAYPRSGATVMPDSATLSFTRVDGVESYRVDVEDTDGNVVFSTELRAGEVTIPTSVLRPGASYFWTVRNALRNGATYRREEGFVTLPEEELRSLAAFRAALETQRSAPSLALLGEVDRQLGLLREARDAFRAAVELAPADPDIKRALQRVEESLGRDDAPGCGPQ